MLGDLSYLSYRYQTLANLEKYLSSFFSQIQITVEDKQLNWQKVMVRYSLGDRQLLLGIYSLLGKKTLNQNRLIIHLTLHCKPPRQDFILNILPWLKTRIARVLPGYAVCEYKIAFMQIDTAVLGTDSHLALGCQVG